MKRRGQGFRPRKDRQQEPKWQPTPAEIKAATLLIQEGWSEFERATRCVRPQAVDMGRTVRTGV